MMLKINFFEMISNFQDQISNLIILIHRTIQKLNERR